MNASISCSNAGIHFYLERDLDKKETHYFSTRDLMMMAALAAVGGITSTYVNMIGDFFQSFLGFAGTTQWAAGLHIIWLMLAASMIRKPGAATTAGVIKGIVEFLTGNTHGLIVLIVNITAGLIIDLILIGNKQKKLNFSFYLAAGVSSASNIIVFQFFAAIPSDVLTLIAILSTSMVSFGSGVVFGGLIVRTLLTAIEKAGIYHPEKSTLINKKKSAFYLISAVSIMIIIALVLIISLGSSNFQNVRITGEVNAPYEFSVSDTEIELLEISEEHNGVARDYIGCALIDIVNKAEPKIENGLILIKASDGYSYFVSYTEALGNDHLILAVQNGGKTASYNIVGAESPKAWVRGVSELILMENEGIQVEGDVNKPFTFLPDEWQSSMDSANIDFGDERIKLQGVQLREIVDYSDPKDKAVEIVLVASEENRLISYKELNGSMKEYRIFISQGDSGVEYIFANMSGDILLRNLIALEIRK
jgi:energy-coupling factor transport system substrate-specific component